MDRLDWLWKGETVVAWTVNLSLLVNLVTQVFGSGGVDLAGASAVILPSLITLYVELGGYNKQVEKLEQKLEVLRGKLG